MSLAVPQICASHFRAEAQTANAGAPPSGRGQRENDSQSALAPSGYHELRIFAEMLEDAQKARISCVNRVERGGVDKTPFLAQLESLETAEGACRLAMKRCYRRVVDPSIVLWQKDARGVGELLLARLLGVIGHPRHTTAHHWEGEGDGRHLVNDGEMERRVSDLWSYCGHGDATRKRTRGMSAEDAAALGSPRAKMLVHLLAEAQVKSRGAYRSVYDERRLATAGRGWTPMHSHNDALRIVGKTTLKDLWLVSEPNHD